MHAKNDVSYEKRRANEALNKVNYGVAAIFGRSITVYARGCIYILLTSCKLVAPANQSVGIV